MYFVESAGDLKHENLRARVRRGEERTHLVNELGEDMTVNVAADLSQEEPVAQTELSAALSHLAVLNKNYHFLLPPPLSLPAPSGWISGLG